MSPVLRNLTTTLRAPSTREFLTWCAPALVLGLVLRLVLMAHLPWAYYHDDAPDFLTTPDRLLTDHTFELHAKKTFLVPSVFTVPFLLHLPALIVIPVFQHFLGLGLILMIGLLCRFWFQHWRVFILPLTLLAAANPFYLWYEHTIMAELIFVCTTVLVTLAGTLYALETSRGRFYFLLVALFLEAGTRPEGKLLFGFAILLLVLLHFRTWRLHWRRVATLVVLAVVMKIVTKTSQAGLLLYTSVARLTPTELRSAPGFDPYIASIRTDLQQRWTQRPQFPRVRDRREISAAVEQYLRDHPAPELGKRRRGVDALCLRLALETCLRNFSYLPIHALHKFRNVATEAPSGFFDRAALYDKQRESYLGSADRVVRLSTQLTGQPLADREAINAFIDTHYGEVSWFNWYQQRWLNGVNHWRFPDQRWKNPENRYSWFYHRGVPFYFLAAALGLLAVAFRPGRLQLFHIVWGLTLLAFFFTIMLTANVRPRFRFVMEPYWFLYLTLLLECVWLAVRAPFRRRE